MTQFTPIFGLPFPEITDAPDGPTQFEDLAVAVENEINSAVTVLDADINAVEGDVSTLQSDVLSLDSRVDDLEAGTGPNTRFYTRAGDTVRSSATMTDDPYWASLAVGAGEVWQVEFYVGLVASGTGGDFDNDWAVTGTVTTSGRHTLGVPASEVGGGTAFTATRDTATDASSGVGTSTNTRSSYREVLLVSGGGSGGTLTWRNSQDAASGTTTILAADSWMVWRRVA